MLKLNQSGDSITAPNAEPVLVIGEALVDCFADTSVPGGAPFNVARSLGAFGVKPVMITRIGHDDAGALLCDEFHRFGLPLEGLQHDATRPTGSVQVTSTANGHMFSIGDNSAWDAIDPIAAASVVHRLSPSIICFGTLAQRSPTSRAAISAVLDRTTALRVLDLNLRTGADTVEIAEWSLASADVVKANDDELEKLLAWFVPGNSPSMLPWGTAPHSRAIEYLVRRFSLCNLVVTRGAQGYAAFDSRGTLLAQGDSPQTNIVDTVGAGDGFLAIMILGEWLGWTLPQTLDRANRFAADVCTLRGAVADNMQFYEHWAREWQLPREHA